jgi:hypothetical protein
MRVEWAEQMACTCSMVDKHLVIGLQPVCTTYTMSRQGDASEKDRIRSASGLFCKG